MSEILSEAWVARTKHSAEMGEWDWVDEIETLCDSHEALRAKVKDIADMAEVMRAGCDVPGEITCPVLVTIWDAMKEFPE